MHFSLSIVIPANNEANRLTPTLQKITDYFQKKIADYEIIVVDDGSTDETYALAQNFSQVNPKVQTHRLTQNCGKGAALAAGIAIATKLWTLLYDADGATPIHEIKKFESLLPSPNNIYIGSRAKPERRIITPQSMLRRQLGKLFVSLRKTIVGLDSIEDTQCGFKLLPTKLAKSLFSDLKTPGFLFDIEILGKGSLMGVKIHEIGIDWGDVSGSKVRISKMLFESLSGLFKIRSILKSMDRPSLEFSLFPSHGQQRSTQGQPPATPNHDVFQA